MKVFKLKGLDYYTIAFDIHDAVAVFWLNKIGVTVENIEEVDLPFERENVGKLLKSPEELLDCV